MPNVEVLLPLVVQDSRLAIPQASATQDGYLSKHDFLLFSGATLVPVTSFNTRTGEVVLLEDDVLAALGYVPLNKHGDTMTGPLTLAGPPTLPLHAATRAFVESVGGGPGTALLAGHYLASAFSASGSKLTYTGNCSPGSTTLILSTGPSHDFVVGQGLLVKDGLGIGNNLVTTIDSMIGGTLTLHNAPSVSGNHSVQHDDTVAIQAAIDYVYNAGGGTLWIEPGFYRLNGPLNSLNSLLTVPFAAFDSSQTVPIAIKGTVPQPGVDYYGNAYVSTLGAILQTDVHNTSAAIFRPAAPVMGSVSPSTISNISLTLEDLTFRTYDNPQISCIDCWMVSNVTMRSVVCDVGKDMQTAVQPTASDVFGIRYPPYSTTSVGHLADSVYVQNYYTGHVYGELVEVRNGYALRCMVGVQFVFSYHPSVGHMVFYQCATPVYFADRCVTQFVFNLERSDPGNWWSPTAGHDLYDPTDQATGFNSYVCIRSVSGTPELASITGCSHMTLHNLCGLGATEPALTISGDAAISGGLNLGGTFRLSDGTSIQPVTFGATDSATTGFRGMRIPNTGSVALLTGLVSYWKMNESSGASIDSVVASANNLGVVGTVTTETGQAGLGNCRRGAGAGYLAIADNPLLDFHTVPKSITINGWINVVEYSSFPLPCLLSKWGTPADFAVIYNNAAGHWQFSVTADGSTSIDATLTTPTLLLNTWYMVTAIFDLGLGHISIQINGGMASTTPFAGPIFHGAAPLTSLAFSTFNSDARVDEVGLWTRVLNGTEIAALYAGGAGLTYPF